MLQLTSQRIYEMGLVDSQGNEVKSLTSERTRCLSHRNNLPASENASTKKPNFEYPRKFGDSVRLSR